jgi:cell wall assembly regulator SMI1
MEVEDAFLEIIEILKAHGGPVPDLPPPATEGEILLFEKAVGRKLPSALRRIYKVHNGEIRYGDPLPDDKTLLGVFFDYPFLDLTSARKEHEAWAQVRRDLMDIGSSFDSEITSHPDGAVHCVYSDPGWVPFAGNAPSLGLDYSPGPTGIAGQVINFSRDDMVHFQIAPDFKSFVYEVLAAYRRGQFNSRFGGTWNSLYDELMRRRANQQGLDRAAPQ